ARQQRQSEPWRWWLSLALALAIGLALTAAALRPEPGAAGAPRRLIVVMDTAPSMATLRADGRSRLDHASEALRRLLGEGGRGDRIALLDTMGTGGAPSFQDAAAALAAAEALQPAAAGRPRLPDLAALAGAVAGTPVLFITDGVWPQTLPAGARTVSVFEPAANVGITAFEVRAAATDPRRFEAFVEVANAGREDAQVRVSIGGAGRDAVQRELSVPARDYRAFSVPVSGFAGGALRATVRSPGDGFAGDDAAWAFLPLNRFLRVALVTAGNPSLERALRLDARLRVEVLPPATFRGREAADLYVFDRFAPAEAPDAPALLWRPPRAPWLPALLAERTKPVVETWLEGHPALENVSLRDTQIERAAAFDLPVAAAAGAGPDAPWAALARAGDGTVLVAAAAAAPRRLAVGFALEDSAFAATASFPVFVANAVQWLSDEPPAVVREPGTVTVPMENARIFTPDGDTPPVRHVPGATLVEAREAMLFTAEGPQGRMRVIAQSLDASRSDVNASALAATPLPDARGGRSSAPPWLWLLALGGLLMLVEWLAWNRRVTE
ncbi:MAG: hypothetical protein ACK52I_34670, partial [Pseudomonadota bacterium]